MDFALIEWVFIKSNYSNTIYDINFKERMIRFWWDTTVVFHKWVLKEIYVKEISEGMIVPYFKDKEDHLLDYPSLRSWIALYRRFDENTGTFTSYAYKGKKEKVSFWTETFDHLWLHERLHIEKFIEIIDPIEETHFHTISWTENVLSLLLWIAIIYWKFSIQDNTLLHTTIQLPLVENIALYEETLLQMISTLTEAWYFMTTNHIQQKSWQLLQISIWDEEILSLWAWWMWLSKVDLSAYKQKLSTYIWSDISDKLILKFLHK